MATPGRIPLVIVLEGVSERWQMNVLQFLGNLKSVEVKLDGHGTIEAPAILISPDQARHLATQITECLGPEYGNELRCLNARRLLTGGNS